MKGRRWKETQGLWKQTCSQPRLVHRVNKTNMFIYMYFSSLALNNSTILNWRDPEIRETLNSIRNQVLHGPIFERLMKQLNERVDMLDSFRSGYEQIKMVKEEVPSGKQQHFMSHITQTSLRFVYVRACFC